MACLPFRRRAWIRTGSALGLALGLGCAPPPPFTVPPPAGQAGPGAPEVVQSRTLPIAPDQVFPRVLGVLLDMGYQIRSANRELMFVNIHRTWFDETLVGRPELSMGATLLFEAAGPGTTRVRILPTGRWSRVNSVEGGSATVTLAEPSLDPKESQRFLDQLARRLCPDPANGR